MLITKKLLTHEASYKFMRFNGKSWERFGELQTGN